jgi:hypothetical protein
MRHEPDRSCFAIDAVHCVYYILRTPKEYIVKGCYKQKFRNFVWVGLEY